MVEGLSSTAPAARVAAAAPATAAAAAAVVELSFGADEPAPSLLA